MKKIIFALFAILCLSFNLKAEDKPKIDVLRVDGQANFNAQNQFVGISYDYVSQTYNPTAGKWNLVCKDKGPNPCNAYINGETYPFHVPSIDNSEITYEFDAVLIYEIANDILSEIDNGCFQRGELSGNKTKKVGMYDLSGKFHYVNFLAAYKLNELGDGNIAFYIGVIE